jgi:hypothetical protein
MYAALSNETVFVFVEVFSQIELVVPEETMRSSFPS